MRTITQEHIHATYNNWNRQIKSRLEDTVKLAKSLHHLAERDIENQERGRSQERRSQAHTNPVPYRTSKLSVVISIAMHMQ